jgi:hypothetical protein
MIASITTSAALRLGSPNDPTAGPLKRATAARAEAVRPAITETTHLSTRAAANALNRRGVTTATGRQWHTMSVLRARDRLGL